MGKNKIKEMVNIKEELNEQFYHNEIDSSEGGLEGGDNDDKYFFNFKGHYGLKKYEECDPEEESDDYFQFSNVLGVMKFHHAMIFQLKDDSTTQYVKELIKIINDSDKPCTDKKIFEGIEYRFPVLSSKDTLKTFKLFNRYTFNPYENIKNKVVLFNNQKTKKISIGNKTPECGDHHFALEIIDKNSGVTEAFGLYW